MCSVKQLLLRLPASLLFRPWVVFLLAAYGLTAMGALAHAGSLPKQGANVVACAEKMSATLSLEKRLRICKVQRSRSLLFKGVATSCSDPQDDANVKSCSMPDSVSATGAQHAHTPSGETAPIARDQIGQVYAGYEFWIKGTKYKMAADNQIQRWKDNQWETICQLNLAAVDCVYEQGTNSQRVVQHYRSRLEGKCNYQALHFYPALSHINVVETTSRIGSRRVRVPMFPDRTDFFCTTSEESFRKSWTSPAAATP